MNLSPERSLTRRIAFSLEPVVDSLKRNTKGQLRESLMRIKGGLVATSEGMPKTGRDLIVKGLKKLIIG